ncbi:MAG: LamG domain-containing protein [Candidatus Omnitrophica bacterium]|nr:LamG domain-containing protein [Candidatus Omnitrophota bacterium]
MEQWRIGFIIFALSICIAAPCGAQLDESLLTWKPDRGISFDGSVDYIQVDNANPYDVDQISVECWVKFRDNTGQQQIAGRGEAAQYFTLYANNGNLRFLVENAGVGYSSAESAVPPADAWVHIAGTYDGETIRLYYNGVIAAEEPMPGLTAFGDDTLMIGALVPGQRHFNGILENLRIWSKALTGEEIVQLLQTDPDSEDIDQMKQDGLLSYWSSRSLQDSIVQDLAGDSDGAVLTYSLDESNLTFKPEAGIPFDGKSNYILVEDGTPFNFLNFSLEVWVRFDKIFENQVFMNRGGAPQLFTFYLYDRVRFLVQDAGNYSHANAQAPPANNWIHIIGTINEIGQKRLYYNGVLVGENEAPPLQLDSDAPLYMGALEPGMRHLDGQMENMRIWNRDLSEEEILALLSTPPEEENIEEMKSNGLVAYWALRSMDGDVVHDLTGNGHDGTYHQFAIDESLLAFKPETGISFDGETNYAVIEDIDPLLLDQDGNFLNQVSVEAWLYLDPIFTDRQLSDRGIFGQGGADQSFALFATSQYGNRIHMFLEEMGDSAAPMPPVESWIHICGTYDENSIRLYYNGVLVDDVDAPGFVYWGDWPFYVGALSAEGGFFEGRMENIRYWNRALSEEEIRALLAVTPENEDIDQMRQDGLIAYYSSQSLSGTVLQDISGNGNDALWNGEVKVADWSLY